MAYEKLHEPLASPAVYLRRVASNLGLVGGLTALSLAWGMASYHALGPMSWPDAFANASMIMSGMGPLSDLKSPMGKLFEGAYALFSGLVLIICASLILGPVIHRFLHRLHLADEDENDGDEDGKRAGGKTRRR